MSDDDDNGRVCDSYFLRITEGDAFYELEIHAFGENKAERKQVLDRRLDAAVTKIVNGNTPEQERTRFRSRAPVAARNSLNLQLQDDAAALKNGQIPNSDNVNEENGGGNGGP